MSRHDFYRPDFAVKIEGLTLMADVRNATRSLSYDNNIDTADMFSLQLDNAGLRLCDSALFDVGKDVEIHMGYEGELEPMMLGEITAINPSLDAATRATIVEASLPNAGGAIRAGMFATAQIALSDRERAVFVPRGALLADPNTNSFRVFVVEDNVARLRVGERVSAAELEPLLLGALRDRIETLSEEMRASAATWQ